MSCCNPNTCKSENYKCVNLACCPVWLPNFSPVYAGISSSPFAFRKRKCAWRRGFLVLVEDDLLLQVTVKTPNEHSFIVWSVLLDVGFLFQGVLLSSSCLERNLPHMFQLWSDIFNRYVLQHFISPAAIDAYLHKFPQFLLTEKQLILFCGSQWAGWRGIVALKWANVFTQPPLWWGGAPESASDDVSTGVGQWDLLLWSHVCHDPCMPSPDSSRRPPWDFWWDGTGTARYMHE